VKSGDAIVLGDDIVMSVVFPEDSYTGERLEDPNDGSVASRDWFQERLRAVEKKKNHRVTRPLAGENQEEKNDEDIKTPDEELMPDKKNKNNHK